MFNLRLMEGKMSATSTSETQTLVPVKTEPAPSPEVQPRYDLDDPALYINRELSLLEFNRRVLEEAEDPRHPLLERAKFLAIYNSNMDEFFMVRVAGLMQQVAAGVTQPPADGLTPAEQLIAIRKKVRAQLKIMYRCYQEIHTQLSEAGVHLHYYHELTKSQQEGVDEYFRDEIFPVLTPLAFDPGRPFPHISSLSLNLAVLVRDPDTGEEHFARIKVPNPLPRLVPVKRIRGDSRRTYRFVWLEDLITHNLDHLFPGYEIVQTHQFRITRNADLEIEASEAADLLEAIEATVRRRRFGFVVRLTVAADMPRHVRELLANNLNVGPEDIYESKWPLGLSALISLMQIDRPDLKDPPYRPVIHPRLRNLNHRTEIFDAIREGDILLHHPYDSFVPVIDFLKAAARDPDVLAIKQTLYRAGTNSPVVEALMEASENDKQVSALIELKARFDEESNISWAKALERAGVHVVYGFMSLKTHSKIALVVRREEDRIRRYVHLSTGNYNAVTANVYTDLGLFTCKPEFGDDATNLFNALTGYSKKEDYRKFLVAPLTLRKRFAALIDREIKWAKKGQPAKLIFKMNSLIDPKFIRQLYEASMAGVKIELLVRGICGLRPGIPGLSDNIRVISIVGRFLEHSRIYYFHNGGNPDIYIGSADLMPRNLDRRIETLFPIEDPALKEELIEILEISLADNVQARILRADGSYVRLTPGDAPPRDSQAEFMARAQSR
uniref:Polyphosphate kinase n=1 Tax=uncultured Chloroflexota bacterium TaxID=166587 RepID=H5SPD9_9CHLR|nr:polyphosphate kinase [uncultured Chloroflexota bacterium]